MSSVMVIIVSHNGWDYLAKCLLTTQLHLDSDKRKVLVVDTCSSDEKFSEYAKDLCKNRGVYYGRLDEPLYELGAMKYAFERFPNEPHYFIQHDSIIAKHDEAYSGIFKKLETADVCSWILFPRDFCAFSYPVERELAIKWTGTDNYDFGIYGNTFAINNEPLKQIYDGHLINMESRDKFASQAMERTWAILFKLYGFTAVSLEEELLTSWHNNTVDGWIYFDKMKHRKGPRQ